MNKILALIYSLVLVTCHAYAAGKIQNEDVKSLTDIESVISITGNLTSGSACIASPSSTTGISAGLFVYDQTTSTNIGSGVTVVALPGTCSAGQIQISSNAAGNGTGDTITFGGQASQLINDTKIWSTGATPPQTLYSAISTGAIGGSGGSKNYLTSYKSNPGNGNFEAGTTTGWSLGTIGTLTNGLPTGSPTFGSGASGNLSISAITSGAIAGTYSLSYASSAATTAGNMLATSSFAIDTEDQAKVMTVKFYYTVNSGASNDNFSGTSSNSFAWAAYDVTNSVWLSSTGNFCMVQSSGQGYCTGTLQTGSSTANMRFVFYNANATSGATTLYLDDFSVGPQTAPFGPAFTDWVTYTPTLNTGAIGTAATNIWQYRREGDSMRIRAQVLQTAAGTSGSGTYTFTIPSGFSLNTSKIPTAQSTSGPLGYQIGYGSLNCNGTATYGSVPVVMYDTTHIALGPQNNTNTMFSSSTCSFGNTTVSLTVDALIPIQGWSSNSAMSSDTDTRIVAMSSTATTGASMGTLSTSYSAVVFNTIGQDTHGAYNSTTGVYTIPVTGYYDVSASIVTSGTAALNTQVLLQLYNVTSSSAIALAQAQSGGAETSIPASLSVNGQYFAAGTQIEMRAEYAGTYASGAYATAPTQNYFTISRRSGPSVIAATESVNMLYTGSTTAASSSQPFVFTTKVFDTHNAYSTSTGQFTAPVSGKYQINWSLNITSTTEAGGMLVYINGAAYSGAGSFEYAGPNGGAALVYIQAGQTIDVRPTTAYTASNSLNAVFNSLSISRVGN